MSDIWSVGGSEDGSVGQADVSEEWDCTSSDGGDERPRKRAKRGGSSTRPQRTAALPGSQPADDEDEVELLGDDLLGEYLSKKGTPKVAGKPGKKAGKGKLRSPSPLLFDDDLELLEGTADAEPAATAAAAAAAEGRTSTRSSKHKAAGNGRQSPGDDHVRQAAQHQRQLREQLAKATYADEDDEDDDVEVLDDSDDYGGAFPAGRVDLTGEDPTSLLDDLEASQPEPAAAALHAPAAGGAAADDADKLPLVFQAQGHDKITIRVQRNQPLSQALEICRKYATDQGWGRVSKFAFDGENLNGSDTAEDLDMEADDVVDVYVES